jgi:hypothetical protein
MTWWIVGVSAFVLLQVGVRRPRAKAWVRDRYVKRLCAACGVAIPLDAAVCPACHTTCEPSSVQPGRKDLKDLQRRHEAFVDDYVAEAGGREALGARVVARAGAEGLEWTTEQAEAAIDLWRVQWMKPAGFEPTMEKLLGQARRSGHFEQALFLVVFYLFAWGGLGLLLSRQGVGAFTDSGEWSFRVTPHGTGDYLWLAGTFAASLPIAILATWLVLKAVRRGWLTLDD